MTALRTILPPPPLLHPFCKPTGYHPTDRVTEPSAPGGENLRTRRVSTGERGRRGACVRGRNRSTPSPLLLCYPRQPVSLVVTCAPCDEVVLEAEVFDHEEECLLRDHLLLVQPRTISARDPRRAAGISSSPNRRRPQRSRPHGTARSRSISPRSSGMRSDATSVERAGWWRRAGGVRGGWLGSSSFPTAITASPRSSL